MANDSVKIYTDGYCFPNPGVGGWGAIIFSPGKEPLEIYGGEIDTTNNRMELMGAIKALGTLKRSCDVKLYTDSRYVQNAIMNQCKTWLDNGKCFSGGYANKDLLEKLFFNSVPHQIECIWVKGHSGDPHNERADKLAYQGAMEIYRSADKNQKHSDADFILTIDSDCCRKYGNDEIIWECHNNKTKQTQRFESKPNHPKNNPMTKELQTIKLALEGVPVGSKIVVCTNNESIITHATRNLSKWAKNGYRKKDGNRLYYADYWLAINNLIANRDVAWKFVPPSSSM